MDREFYSRSVTPDYTKEQCRAKVWTDGESFLRPLVTFMFMVDKDGYADVIVLGVDLTPAQIDATSDFKSDILVAIGDHINRKINEISWQ